MFIGRLYASLAALSFQKDVFMNYLSVYAFIQIVGESLPLSSSGNVKVWTTLCNTLGLLSIPSVPVSKNIDFLLHIPTLLILLIFFFKRWTPYLPWYQCPWTFTVRVILWTMLVDLITSVFYFIAIFNKPLFPLWVSFIITAGFLYSTRQCTITTTDSIFNFKKGLAFGAMQSFAVIPGISRFAATFALARWYGYKPADALWYCFLIQIPLLIVAGISALLPCFIYPHYYAEWSIPFSVVAVTSLSAYGVLTVIAQKADRCTFWHFSWYALGLAALAFCLGL